MVKFRRFTIELQWETPDGENSVHQIKVMAKNLRGAIKHANRNLRRDWEMEEDTEVNVQAAYYGWLQEIKNAQ